MQCPNCKIDLVFKEGVSKNTGKPYKFWGCSNFPECKYIFKQATQSVPEQKTLQSEEIMEALRKVWKRLDEIHADLLDLKLESKAGQYKKREFKQILE